MDEQVVSIDINTVSVISEKPKRIEWVDFAKGITILLVILGHSSTSVVRGMIYSFHMPLFFVMNAITSHFSNSQGEIIAFTEKTIRRLFIPAVSICCLKVLLTLISMLVSDVPVDWVGTLTVLINTIVYASGDPVYVMGGVVPAIGIPWFLIALLCSRTLYNYLQLKLKWNRLLCAVTILAIIGAKLGQVQWLPFSADIALAVLPFFIFGNYLKKIDLEHHSLLFGFLSLLGWTLTFFVIFCLKNDYLEFAGRRYPLFPLCYVSAAFATLFICYLGVVIGKSRIAKPFQVLGRYSMYILCVHYFDSFFGYIWCRSQNIYVNALLRIILDIAVALIIVKFIAIIKLRLKLPRSE